jgi:hypothetical protein
MIGLLAPDRFSVCVRLTEPARLTEHLEAMGDEAYGLSQICRLFHDSTANRLAVNTLLRRRQGRLESECPESSPVAPSKWRAAQ